MNLDTVAYARLFCVVLDSRSISYNSIRKEVVDVDFGAGFAIWPYHYLAHGVVAIAV